MSDFPPTEAEIAKRDRAAELAVNPLCDVTVSSETYSGSSQLYRRLSEVLDYYSKTGQGRVHVVTKTKRRDHDDEFGPVRTFTTSKQHCPVEYAEALVSKAARKRRA